MAHAISNRSHTHMTEPTMAETPTEGEITFTSEVKADDTATESPAENKDTEDTQSADGDDEENNQQDPDEDADDEEKGVDDKTPFHEHPRWKQREEEWTERFNNQEVRHQEDIQKLREEFTKSKDTVKSEEVPDWFGGTPEQWESFRQWNQSQIESAEKGAISKIDEAKSAEDKAVQEATEYFQSELKTIEQDKTLNPTGAKIDPNKLLKVVMENELIDSKGRWNYKAGVKIMQAMSPTKSIDNNNKKKIAGATTSESKGDPTPKTFKTDKDFKQNRPW